MPDESLKLSVSERHAHAAGILKHLGMDENYKTMSNLIEYLRRELTYALAPRHTT